MVFANMMLIKEHCLGGFFFFFRLFFFFHTQFFVTRDIFHYWLVPQRKGD